LARLVSALYQGDRVDVLPGIWDQLSYHNLALRVLDGQGFSFSSNWWPATAAGAPTAHWSFLYVLYLAFVYLIFGPSPLAAKVIQAVVTGILMPVLTYRITRRIFGGRVATAAALLISVYGYFIYYGGALVTETFYIVAILWLLDISTQLASNRSLDPASLSWERRHPACAVPGAPSTVPVAQAGRMPAPTGSRTVRPWVWLGIACGLAILFRQLILLAIPLVLRWTLWRVLNNERRLPDFSYKRLAWRGAVPILVIGALILPWTLRNYAVFGRFVLLNTNAGFVLFWGNHPLHKTDFIPIIGGGPAYGSLIPARLQKLNEAELDRQLLQRGFRFVADDPRRFALLSLSRSKEYFKFWPTKTSGLASNLTRVFSFGIYLPLFLSGLVLAALRFRRNGDQDNGATLLLLLLSTLYTGIHLLSWTLVRYRLPVDALMMPFGGLGLVCLVDWARSRAARLIGKDCRQTPIENPAHF